MYCAVDGVDGAWERRPLACTDPRATGSRSRAGSPGAGALPVVVRLARAGQRRRSQGSWMLRPAPSGLLAGGRGRTAQPLALGDRAHGATGRPGRGARGPAGAGGPHQPAGVDQRPPPARAGPTLAHARRGRPMRRLPGQTIQADRAAHRVTELVFQRDLVTMCPTDAGRYGGGSDRLRSSDTEFCR